MSRAPWEARPGARKRPPRKRPGAGLALACLAALLAGAAAAQDLRDRGRETDAPFDLTSESLEYERGRDLYVARGNVRISQPDRTLTADWVAFSNQTGRGLATGNVVVTEAGDTLYADVLVFEVDSLRGVVFEGRLDARDSEFVMTGREVRKTGDETYEFEEGTFTTCRCPDDGTEPWKIRAESADLEVGGYGTARNSTFEVLGVPVLWLPWTVYPLKTERQTGLLFPEVETANRTGTSFGLPFFWAAAPNLNVTITPRYLTQRGFQPRLDVEYLLGETAEGILLASGLHDTDVDSDDPDTPFSAARWGAEWLHEQQLPWGFRGVADGRAFSDNQYAFDFRDFSGFRDDRFVESRGFVDRRFGAGGRDGVFLALWHADDLQNPEDQDRDDFLPQRLPQLFTSVGARPLPGLGGRLVAGLDVDYVNFTPRERAGRVFPELTAVDDLFFDTGVDGIPDGREQNPAGIVSPGFNDDFGEGNGRFDEGEPLADRGQRMVVNPRLGLPVRLFDAVELFAEAAWHGTLYETRNFDADLRSLFTGQLDLRTRLRRALPLPLGLGDGVHVMEPRLAWTGISSASQRRNPLLVPATAFPQVRLRQLDLYNLTRDPADRIESLNAVTVGLGNRFYVPDGEGGPPRLLADVALSAQYEISQDDLRSLLADGRLHLAENFISRFNLGYDMGDTNLSEALVDLGWSSEAGHDVGIEYRYLRDVPQFFESFPTSDDRFDEAEDAFDRVHQLGVFGRAALTRRWALTYAGIYSFEDSIFLRNEVGVEYVSRCRCWAVRVQVEDERQRGIDVNLRYTLIGLGEDTVRPFERRPVVRRPGG